MLNEYTDGKRTINATTKAYELFYKKQGFKEVMEGELIEDVNVAYDLALKEELSNKNVEELKNIAKEKELEGYSKLKKDELIELIEGE